MSLEIAIAATSIAVLASSIVSLFSKRIASSNLRKMMIRTGSIEIEFIGSSGKKETIILEPENEESIREFIKAVGEVRNAPSD